MLADIPEEVEKLSGEGRETDGDELAAAFRRLRNGCASGQRFQDEAGSRTSLVESSVRILRSLSLPRDALPFRVGLQFIANLVVAHSPNQDLVWDRYLDDILNFSMCSDSKARNYMAMAIHNLILDHPTRSNALLSNKELVSVLISDAGEGSEFPLFVLETFIKQGYFRRMYNEAADCRQHLLLLEVIQSGVTTNKEIITEDNICFISEQFKRKSDCILKTVGSYTEGLEPEEVSKLLSVLCSISSSETYLKLLQKDKSLLVNCAFLLRSIHTIGKQGPNQFSVESTFLPSEEMAQQPTFSFKADLIRLIGNMVYGNSELQNLVRELDSIPILLDCCKIDAKNPFILQWSIFAIRNLCENNVDNQSVIASIEKMGEIDSSIVSQLGLTLHSEGDKSITLVPLQKK